MQLNEIQMQVIAMANNDEAPSLFREIYSDSMKEIPG